MSTAAHPSVESRKVAATRVAATFLTETGLARLAFAVGAIHVVDDNFLQPQPGTSAGDHLVGGLVQTSVFVLFAWVYPRLQAGARATLALGVGVFMVVMGASEAGYYMRENGLSGDDYTGILLIPAGVLLIGIGFVTFWRSKKGGRLVWRYARRALIAFGLLVGAYFVIFPLGESYAITHAARAYVPEPQLGTAFQEISFTTPDGLQLEGWYVPSKNGAAVISFPGRRGPRKPAKLLARHGYGVLLFDRRGEGESEGDPNLLGWQGTRDIEGAVAFLKSRPEVDDEKIGGLGLSVGGEMMLQEAAENNELKAVVSEGAGIRSVREAVHMDGPAKVVGSWAFGIVTLGTAVWTSNLPPRSLTDLSAEITQPALFIHATPGQGGETLTEKYYDAAKGPKEYWAAPGGHTGAIDAAPEEYERRVVGFFDRSLLR
ncbi:MAG TPA: CocE/NonD family hydrolase [Gaiellaceae bacterium]|nr:CocE/NonD family hydrolase [Gaiellaceae bacterium]